MAPGADVVDTHYDTTNSRSHHRQGGTDNPAPSRGPDSGVADAGPEHGVAVMSTIMGLLDDRRPLLPFGAGGFKFQRWLFLEGNRATVTLSLLLFTFVAMLISGMAWTFEMQKLLTETQAVQTLLNTLLSGIILLVSIVVSISAIVLSYDITSLDAQQDRIEATTEFRRDVERLTDVHQNPTDPESVLRVRT
jgi:hypothetical protein